MGRMQGRRERERERRRKGKKGEVWCIKGQKGTVTPPMLQAQSHINTKYSGSRIDLGIIILWATVPFRSLF